MEELFDPDKWMEPEPGPAVFDDGICVRTKISLCPATFKPFVNRCTKEAFHASGCSFVTKRQDGPEQQTLFRQRP